ncbi:uncharacterized protein LOC110447287 [Mizuhopecten yessoensis]|uniref:uncharacterized protein LOC110447287 n=1 Tax=Mizuhopecten yessoensis TaxID=6573 RepID=UPI000B4576C1|nr:uncharacterized protein LOC110447287 [Mizuhopecten yessoensis]
MYQNTEGSSSITMRCAHLTSASCELYGTFSYGKEMYQIQPSGDGIYSPYEISLLDVRNRRFINVNGDAKAVIKQLEGSEKFKKFGKEQIANSRKRRAIDTDYVGEMVVWMDLSVWTRILAVSGTETAADADAETYAIALMNDADTRVRNLDVQYQENGAGVSFSCSLMLVHLEICKQSSDCQWSEGVVSNGVITSSTAYMSDVLNQAFALEGPAGIANSYDFMNLLTAYEVVDSTGVTGCGAIFQRDLMCRVVAAARVSVTMIRDGGVGFNTAHFFAMHVGAENDENSAACTSADQFASAFKWERASMSTANAVNPWRWSTCALDQIQQTIEEDSSYVACLTDQNFSTEDYDAYHAQGALGKTLSAEDQCRYAFGDGSTFCGTQDETVCYLGLDCTNPDTNACDEVIYALEGSICNQEGNANAYCLEGVCDVPTTTSRPTTTTPIPTTTTPIPTTTTPIPTTTTPIPTTTTPIPTTTTPIPTTTTPIPTTTTPIPTTTTPIPTTTTPIPTTTTPIPTTTTTTPLPTTTTTPIPTTTTTTPIPTTTTPIPTTTTPIPTTTTPIPTPTTPIPTTTTPIPTTTTPIPTTTTPIPTTTTTTPLPTTTTTPIPNPYPTNDPYPTGDPYPTNDPYPSPNPYPTADPYSPDYKPSSGRKIPHPPYPGPPGSRPNYRSRNRRGAPQKYEAPISTARLNKMKVEDKEEEEEEVEEEEEEEENPMDFSMMSKLMDLSGIGMFMPQYNEAQQIQPKSNRFLSRIKEFSDDRKVDSF